MKWSIIDCRKEYSILLYWMKKRGAVTMETMEVCFDRLVVLVEEIRRCLQQLPDGPELSEIARLLREIERIERKWRK